MMITTNSTAGDSMKQTFYISILVSLISLVAFASEPNIDGRWVGEGTYILDGEITYCDHVELVFSSSNGEFVFEEGSRNCSKHNETFYRVSTDVANGEVLFAGQVVGHYTDTTVQMGFRQPDGNSFRNWRMSMRRQGNHLMYEESRTMEGESTPLISFAGVLIKKD